MRMQRSIDIAVPAADAWALLSSYDDDPRWRREVTSMVPTPPGAAVVGTTTVETLRMFGSTFTTDGEVVDLVPGRSLAWRASSDAVDASGQRLVDPLTDGTCRVTLSYDLRPKGANRMTAPLLFWAFRRNVRRNSAALVRLLEEAQPRSASASSCAA